MKIAAVSAPFRNGKTRENTGIMIRWIEAAAKQGADLVLFGESALQGFDGLFWELEKDLHIAVQQTGSEIQKISECAKENGIHVSFGYFEQADGNIYSSQSVIDDMGTVVSNFRRVSAGWKVPECQDPAYREGDSFFTFDIMKKRTAIALCGDLWYEERMDEMKALKPELVLWPVYCDYDAEEWNEKVKYEYLEQASRLNVPVVLVSPYCDEDELAVCSKGSCVHFENGCIVKEIPSGKPGMMIAEIN